MIVSISIYTRLADLMVINRYRNVDQDEEGREVYAAKETSCSEEASLLHLQTFRNRGSHQDQGL